MTLQKCKSSPPALQREIGENEIVPGDTVILCSYQLTPISRSAQEDRHQRGCGKLNCYFPELLSLVSAIAVLRMGDQRAISALTKLSNFAGVRSSFFGIDPPRSASFALTAGSSRIGRAQRRAYQ
jgi:hypothetical protein